MLDEGDGGKTIVLIRMEEFVDIEGIEGGIQGTEFGAETKSTFGIRHQREEVSDIGLVKGQGSICLPG